MLIAFIIGIVVLCKFISNFTIPAALRTENNRIISLSIWTFFIIINAYYGGAMTMFLTSPVTIDFETRRDVMQAYPGGLSLVRGLLTFGSLLVFSSLLAK